MPEYCGSMPFSIAVLMPLYASMLICFAAVVLADEGLYDVQSLRFTKPPTDARFFNTRRTRIECKASGIPRPSISWETVDGKTVGNITGIRSVDYDGSLEFHAFEPKNFNAVVHNAKYRCIATNALGRLRSATINVNAVIDKVHSPKVFLQRSFPGGSAVFECMLATDAANHISLVSWTLRWPKTGNVVQLGSGGSKERFHVPQGLRHLVIRSVKNQDNFMRVSCKIKDALNQVILKSSEAFLFVEENPPAKLSLSLPPVSQTVVKGSNVVLPCIANAAPSRVSYSWFKDGARLRTSSRFETVFDGNMMLKDIGQLDAGEYKCTATTANRTASASMMLNIIDSIQFKQRLQDQFIPLGKSVRFSCKVAGMPTPTITWVKDGTPLSKSSRLNIGVSLTDNVLSSDILLYMASHRDEGMYQCIATNTAEEKMTAARLVIGASKPRITSGLQDRQVLEQDHSVRLSCVSTGQPSPTISWWSDGVRFRGSKSRFTITAKSTASGGIQSTLEIQGLRMSDSAVYACKAENKAGIDVSESDIAVSGSPMIINFPENLNALRNQPIYIDCIAKGYPLATYRWTKDSLQNLLSDDQHKIFENGTLMISSVQSKNKGEYRCHASNSFGDDAKTLVLNVQVPPTIAPLEWTPIEAGHRTSKTCQVPTGDYPIRITWYWNGKIIRSTPEKTIYNNDFLSHLQFSEVKAEYRGRYTCKAENNAGSASYSAELVVHEAPVLTVSPADVSVLKPKTLHLKCQAKGFPAPQIVWYKTPEFSDKRELLVLSDRVQQYPNGSLFITSTSAKDNGRYTCSAENGIGKPAEKTVAVDIKVPAKVKRVSGGIVKQRKGESVNVTCEGSGTPTIQLHWYKSSRRVTASSKYEETSIVRKVGNQAYLNSTLNIKSLERGDNGTYVCQVTNSFGGDTAHFNVIVLERPDPPHQPFSGRKTSRWIEVLWKPSFSGHSPILSYNIEYKRNLDSWLKKSSIKIEGDITRQVVGKLSPGEYYNFRVVATNRIGSSESSRQNIFRTNEEAPAGPPLDVTATAIANNKLKIKWRAPEISKRNGLIIGYHVDYKDIKASKREIKVLDSGTFEEVIENLAPYTLYEITVKASTSAGIGPPSPPVRRRTLQGAPTAAPTKIKATAFSSQIIHVTWEPPPENNRHGLVRGYKVKYTERLSKESKEKVVINLKYADLTNLKRFTEYSISVLAFTDGGDGKLSDTVIERTLEDVPGPPDKLIAAAASPHQILVQWRKPSEPNGIITGYILHYRKSMDLSTSQYEFRLSSNESSHMLQGLEVGKEYEIWMIAQTKVGKGLRTGLVRARTMAKIPARILTLTQIVKIPVNGRVELPCVAVGHPKPKISWYFKTSHIIKRKRRSVRYNSEGKLVLSNVQLNDAGAYNCSAVNQYGSDWNIVTLVVQGFPLSPKAIYAEQINITFVNVSWVPGFNAYSPIIRHWIKHRSQNHSKWNEVTVETPWKMFEVPFGTAAYFSIASENSVGIGVYSSILRVRVTSKGLLTKIISKEKTKVLTTAFSKEERENVIGPIIAGCVVAVVIIAIIMLLASWDRTERRLKSPKCNRLFVCECEDDFPKDRFRGPYDGPYSEPNMPWPWNATSNSLQASSDDAPISEHTTDEDRFPEHLFTKLLNFDETEEDEERISDEQGNSSAIKDDLNLRFGTPSTNTYKTSESSQLSKGMFTSNSLMSSRHMQNSAASETDNQENATKLKTRSVEDALCEEKYTQRVKRSYKDQQLEHYFKSLDSGLQGKQNIKVYLNQSTARNGKVNDTKKEHSAPKGIKSLTLLVRDSKVKRSRSVRSYDSVSSTCSSTRGELVRAYEFGRKYKLQEYHVPHIGDSTTEDSCSEISELCEFTSLPRNPNDCLIRMPLPIRPAANDISFGLQVKNLQDPYGGESLV